MSSWIAGLEVLLRRMAHHGLLFAVAAPVTASNEHLLDHTEPFARFARLGARLAVLFDYAPPFGVAADPLSLSPSARRRFVARARKAAAEVSLPLMCVPEDETILGGCTAAGRLVVYVSPLGTIDPCPFVPYSGFHLSSHRLLDAIRSPFFSELRSRSRAWEGSASPECVIDAAGPQACGCVYRRHPEEFDELCRRHGAKLHSLYR